VDCSGCSPCKSCIACFCIWDCIIPGATCCNGICCNSGNCCNSTTCCSNYNDVCCTDSGSYCCESGKTCCHGSCCGSSQCCHNDTCVDKCDPDGAPCPHDSPIIQAGCQWQSPDDHRCFPDQVGKKCMWILQYEYSTSAKCAACAPGCRTRDSYCAYWKAETCRDVMFIGCQCDYKGPADEQPAVGDGDHYICN